MDAKNDDNSSSDSETPVLSHKKGMQAMKESDEILCRRTKCPFTGLNFLWFEYPPYIGVRKTNHLDKFLKCAKKLKFRIDGAHEYNCVRNTFVRSGLERATKSVWNVYWSKHLSEAKLKKISPFQKTNHYPGSWIMGRKDKIARLINNAVREHGKEYRIISRSFVFPSDEGIFIREFEANPKTIWIAKPVASSCGRGIKIFSGKSHKKIPIKTSNSSYMVQQYISKPYLINDRKFDLRVYVLVTSFDPLIAFVFKDGLVRFCTESYSNAKSKIKNKFAHLTNFSVNKRNSEFDWNTNPEADDSGSKWSVKALLRYFEENGVDSKMVWSRICDVALKTLIASDGHIASLVNRYCPQRHSVGCSFFEILGFDVMLDADLKPWLLEVNVSPSLSSSSPLDKRIKNTVVADAFHTMGIVTVDAKQTHNLSGINQKKMLNIAPGAGETKGIGRNKDNLSTMDSRLVGLWLGQITRAAAGGFEPIFPVLPHSHVSLSPEMYMSYFNAGRRSDNLLAAFASGHSAAFKPLGTKGDPSSLLKALQSGKLRADRSSSVPPRGRRSIIPHHYVNTNNQTQLHAKGIPSETGAHRSKSSCLPLTPTTPPLEQKFHVVPSSNDLGSFSITRNSSENISSYSSSSVDSSNVINTDSVNYHHGITVHLEEYDLVNNQQHERNSSHTAINDVHRYHFDEEKGPPVMISSRRRHQKEQQQLQQLQQQQQQQEHQYIHRIRRVSTPSSLDMVTIEGGRNNSSNSHHKPFVATPIRDKLHDGRKSMDLNGSNELHSDDHVMSTTATTPFAAFVRKKFSKPLENRSPSPRLSPRLSPRNSRTKTVSRNSHTLTSSPMITPKSINANKKNSANNKIRQKRIVTSDSSGNPHHVSLSPKLSARRVSSRNRVLFSNEDYLPARTGSRHSASPSASNHHHHHRRTPLADHSASFSFNNHDPAQNDNSGAPPQRHYSLRSIPNDSITPHREKIVHPPLYRTISDPRRSSFGNGSTVVRHMSPTTNTNKGKPPIISAPDPQFFRVLRPSPITSPRGRRQNH